MLIEEDCIPCILKMTLNGLRSTFREVRELRPIFHEIVKKVMGSDEIWNYTSAEIVEKVLVLIHELSGENDLFNNIKKETNQKILQLYGDLQKQILKSQDSLLEALKLSIIGNSIDTMVRNDLKKTLNKLTSLTKCLKVNLDKYKALEVQLSKSKKLLYVGDNSAEAVLDKLFIFTIRDRYDLDVVFVVRNEPTLNDVTMEDAKEIGLSEICSVISNGIKGPLPGIIPNRCSEGFIKEFESADMVIVKGGGNVETLSEEADLRPHVFFLLMCKCNVHERFFGVPVGEAVIWEGGKNRQVST